MALAQKRIGTVDAVTLALWRVAESGDIHEFAALLPRVTNINARNQHGVTALMRAAQNGHVKIVSLLLEHGADANIKRNDKFTALALAAFFGHTEVVRALMEHGADSKASTRNGTSPQMWATARTFNEVVEALEKPVAQAKPLARTKPVAVFKKDAPSAPLTIPVLPAPSAVPTPSPVPTMSAVPAPPAAPIVRTGPAVVRTLKEPPEIWDLVHEVPLGFDARSAFVTRLKSIQTGLAFRAVAALVLIGLSVVGVMVLRGVQARSERTEAQPIITSQPKDISPPPAPAPIAPAPAVPATETQTAVVPEAVAPPLNDDNKSVAVSKPGARLRVASSHRVEPRATRVETTEVQPAVAPSAKPEQPARVENTTTKTKLSVPLSPQLISPVKSSAPKAKVIQWP